MMEHLERALRETGSAQDLERANIIRVILNSRGVDIPFPEGTNPEILAIDSRPSNFGQKLRTYRTRLRWSQLRLAEEISYGQSLVSKIERGARSPDMGFMQAVERVLNLTPDEQLELREEWKKEKVDRIKGKLGGFDLNKA